MHGLASGQNIITKVINKNIVAMEFSPKLNTVIGPLKPAGCIIFTPFLKPKTLFKELFFQNSDLIYG